MPRTSNKSQLILAFVNEFTRDNGYAPSVREIGAAVGLRSTASVSYHLEQLKEKGLLLSPDSKGRKRAIVAAARHGQIPIIGTVRAGVPNLAVEEIDGYHDWDGDPECYALRVRGDSMIDACILEGDILVIRPQQTAMDGEIVVARIGDETTVKRLSTKNGEVWLLPENPSYQPIDGRDAEILGIVKAVHRIY